MFNLTKRSQRKDTRFTSINSSKVELLRKCATCQFSSWHKKILAFSRGYKFLGRMWGKLFTWTREANDHFEKVANRTGKFWCPMTFNVLSNFQSKYFKNKYICYTSFYGLRVILKNNVKRLLKLHKFANPHIKSFTWHIYADNGLA